MARIATVGDGDMDVYNNLGTSYPGGNAVNVGVHLFRLGVETAFVGAVGDDEYGRRVIEKLAAEGLDTSHIQVLHGETAVSEVEFVDNERVFGDYHDGVMLDFKLSPADIDFLCTYDLVHSAMWGMVHDDLHLIRERGVPVSFDFADKLEDNPVTEVAIENCDYAIFSYTEDDTYIRDYLRRMHARGPKVALATLGGNGSVAFDGERFHRHRARALPRGEHAAGRRDRKRDHHLHGRLVGATTPRGASEMAITGKEFCRMLDGTSISPLATKKDMEDLLDLAREYEFYSVIGPRCFVPMLVAGVKGTSTIAGSGCCGDDGCEPANIKAIAAANSIALGAQEIDMVMNLHYFKSGMYDEVVEDIATVKYAIGDHPLKCIIESPVLTDEEIAKATELVIEGGAQYVKTSIGGGHVTTIHQVEIVSRVNRGRIGIKASGGIRDLATVDAMLEFGVNRFGVGLNAAFEIMRAADAR